MDQEAMQFDVEAAIEARIAQKSEGEKERWRKFQIEERAKLKPIDGKSSMGQRMIALAEEGIEWYAKGSTDIDYEFEYTRMAEGYALMGDFWKAEELTFDPEKKKFYQQVLDAPDMECEHGKMIFYDSFPGIQLFKCPVCHHLRKCSAH
jgi:hypothetical protein